MLASLENHSWACDLLGHLFERENNHEKALEFYIKAAELGHPYAAMEVARIYYEGKNIQQDYLKSHFFCDSDLKQQV